MPMKMRMDDLVRMRRAVMRMRDQMLMRMRMALHYRIQHQNTVPAPK